MRLSTDEDRDEERALATIAAAVEEGITVFDTARAYAADEHELGHNERLVAAALRSCGADSRARIVTKGGMTRTGGAWLPDGRAKSIRSDCEASLEALGGLPIDLYLPHAPDPRTPWRTSVRALVRLVEDGLVRRVGVANVNRRQLDEAISLAPVSAVQVSLSVFDDRALRGGVVERCAAQGIALVAHSPLGGQRRSRRVGREPALAAIAEEVGATPSEVALAWLLGLSPVIVAIPGARRPETARSAARAARLTLGEGQRAALAHAFGGPQRARRPRSVRRGEVVLVMGVPGAGKSRLAANYVERGYVRLNRDERGGSLRELDQALEEELSSGSPQVVLDNTYLTRASRSYAVETAARHGIASRCVWLDIPLAQAQANLVERLLERVGRLPHPEELRVLAKSEPGIHVPTTQMRTFRELEPPSTDEGFTSIEHVPFARMPIPGRRRPGVFVAAGALADPGWELAVEQGHPGAPHLLFDWRPKGAPDDLAELAALLEAKVSGPVERAVCPHGGGPPVCWCRPPLPGLPLAFARAHEIDPARSLVLGTAPAQRTLATTLGATYVQV
jgi:aryl-alcohol dehydrogenase-like predicted oxidoreductase/predicted kinase